MDMQIQPPPPELVEQPKHFVKWTDQVRIGAHKDHQEAWSLPVLAFSTFLRTDVPSV